jgi:hypothetical protein
MAIVILGKTVCGICKKVITEKDKCLSFSAFVNNEKDPLYFFNDAAFHTKCVKNHKLGDSALRRQSESSKLSNPKSRKCFVCKKSIDNPDDFFAFGFLPSEEFYEILPYKMCHQSCLKSWEGLQEACDKLTNLQESGKWIGRGPAIELKILKDIVLQKET